MEYKILRKYFLMLKNIISQCTERGTLHYNIVLYYFHLSDFGYTCFENRARPQQINCLKN